METKKSKCKECQHSLSSTSGCPKCFNCDTLLIIEEPTPISSEKEEKCGKYCGTPASSCSHGGGAGGTGSVGGHPKPVDKCVRCELPQSEWKGRWQDPICKVGETSCDLHKEEVGESVNMVQAGDSHCFYCHKDEHGGLDHDFINHLNKGDFTTSCTKECGRWFTPPLEVKERKLADVSSLSKIGKSLEVKEGREKTAMEIAIQESADIYYEQLERKLKTVGASAEGFKVFMDGVIEKLKEAHKEELSQTIQETEDKLKEKIIFKIKEKGLHLGYKNDIIDLINNIKRG